jgi:hypothetical protein
MRPTEFTATPPPTFDEDAPRRRPSWAPRVGAGALLLAAGLALVVLGGCFLIGAVVIANPTFFNPSPPSTPTPASWDPPSIFLFTILNILALVCFVSAGILLVLGFVGLYRILFKSGERPAE